MIPRHPHDRSDDLPDELPELPIPRPGERPTPPAPKQRLAPPKLGGGGASLTANDRSGGLHTMAAQQQLDAERFTWELAARLTSGMLANPSRAHASVKDAMGMFDQFLQEMQVYTRIASEERPDDTDRRAARGEYFHGDGPTATPAAAPSTAATPPATPVKPVKPVKPQPTQPRPSADYRAIPPGARQRPVDPGDGGPNLPGRAA